MSLFGGFRETRHFAKRAAKRPGSQTRTRVPGVRCEQCFCKVKRRRSCAFCLELKCVNCLTPGVPICGQCVAIRAGVVRGEM